MVYDLWFRVFGLGHRGWGIRVRVRASCSMHKVLLQKVLRVFVRIRISCSFVKGLGFR